jgi:hypothetical protein
MIVVDLTVTTPANQMAHAARARQRGHCLLQCIKTRLARSDISLRRISRITRNVPYTSDLRRGRILLKRLIDDPLIERGVERDRRSRE